MTIFSDSLYIDNAKYQMDVEIKIQFQKTGIETKELNERIQKTQMDMINSFKTSQFRLIVVLIPLFLITFQSEIILAQEQAISTTKVGLSATYDNTPEEADFTNTGGNGEIDKFELFLDFGTIRLAVNAIHGIDRSQDPDLRLRSNSAYLAYRARAYDDRDKLDVYMMFGIALVSSAITADEELEGTSDNYGYVLGSGITFQFFEKLAFGFQFLRISAKGELGGDTIETGSDQLQMIFLHPL